MKVVIDWVQRTVQLEDGYRNPTKHGSIDNRFMVLDIDEHYMSTVQGSRIDARYSGGQEGEGGSSRTTPPGIQIGNGNVQTNVF
jgi:hypothetical protein